MNYLGGAQSEAELIASNRCGNGGCAGLPVSIWDNRASRDEYHSMWLCCQEHHERDLLFKQNEPGNRWTFDYLVKPDNKKKCDCSRQQLMLNGCKVHV